MPDFQMVFNIDLQCNFWQNVWKTYFEVMHFEKVQFSMSMLTQPQFFIFFWGGGRGLDFWCISAINLNGQNLVCKLQYGTWTRLISMMYMYMYHSLIFNWMCKRLFHRLHTENSPQETTKDHPKTLNQGWHTYLIPRLACTPQPRLISLPLIYWLNWTQQISKSFKSYQYKDFVMLLMITNTGFHSRAKKS